MGVRWHFFYHMPLNTFFHCWLGPTRCRIQSSSYLRSLLLGWSVGVGGRSNQLGGQVKLVAQLRIPGQTSAPTWVLGDFPLCLTVTASSCCLSRKIFLSFAEKDRMGSQNAEKPFPSCRFLTYFLLLGWLPSSWMAACFVKVTFLFSKPSHCKTGLPFTWTSTFVLSSLGRRRECFSHSVILGIHQILFRLPRLVMQFGNLGEPFFPHLPSFIHLPALGSVEVFLGND